MLCGIILILFGLFIANRQAEVPVRVGQVTIIATIARSQPQLLQGLSNTASLPNGHGMLFVFPYASRWAIWMKDMHYPIDILWLDSSKRIIDSALRVSPATYPHSFAPAGQALYALELPAGFSEKNHILVGQAVQFNL
jgi:uncharacterized membrane protein (UPF0127 family)